MPQTQRSSFTPLMCAMLIVVSMGITEARAQPSREEVSAAMHQAVRFFRKHAAAEGGYVFQLAADLSRREGEGKVGPTTAWLEPPATPAVGIAYLEAYQRCGAEVLLEAARETADALIRGQLRSGGWDNRIEYAAKDRESFDYRVDNRERGKLRNTTTFDDNKSQSAITFLMRLDQQLEFNDKQLHEAVTYALNSALKAQYVIGAWPQRYSDFPTKEESPILGASIPSSWSRTYPKTKYSEFYTINDNTISDLIEMMLTAWEVYDDERFLRSAQLGGDFLLRAQLPEPQPGWAQQYDREMHPAWARKFEPPAITGSESQKVMRTLITLYRRTANHDSKAERYLEPIPRALAYYRRCVLPDGKLARFYELETNRPLFFTKDYQLTYSSNDMPTHYAFLVNNKLGQIDQEFQQVRGTPVEKLWQPKRVEGVQRSASLSKRVKAVVDGLDTRGAWVEPGRLKFHGDDDPTRHVIRSDTFAKNLLTLASWLAE